MKDKLLQMRAKAVQTWNQMSKAQRIGLISGAALLMLVLAITLYSLTRTEYSYAFTDLDAADAAAITTYLQEQGISYKLSSDGRSIGVPSTVATQVKIDVESQGLVQNGSIGFGIFRENVSSFGMTDNQFQVLKTDALAGEIQKLIQGLNGVQKAKVIIHVPQESVFLRATEEPSKASALVTFKPGFTPDQKMIDTIYNLVAHSLPNISMENIYVSDQRGELLPSSKLNGAGTADVISEHFAIKRRFENDIERNVQNMLGRVFPPDKVIVSVVATLNFDKKNSVENRVLPVDEENVRGIEISVEKIQETYSSTGSGDGPGAAGTGETDIPGYVFAGAAGDTESESLTERINYDVNRITSEIISAPFQVKDLTINVAVEPPVRDDPSSLTEETKQAIQTILRNIVATSLADSGRTFTDEELDKKVFVFAHSFDGMEEEGRPSVFSAWYVYALAGLVLGAAVVGGILLARRRRAAEEAAELAPEPAPQPEPVLDIERAQNEHQVRRQLEHLAKRKPEEFVNLLRTWLVDE